MIKSMYYFFTSMYFANALTEIEPKYPVYHIKDSVVELTSVVEDTEDFISQISKSFVMEHDILQFYVDVVRLY